MIDPLVTRGFDKFERMLRNAGSIGDQAASMALNETAQYARRITSAEIRKEIALRQGSISARIRVRRTASPNDLEAIVSAEDRATSLANYSNSPRQFGRQKRSPRVKVLSGGANQPMRGAFWIRLRGNNVGIAVRLKAGERVRNKNKMSSVGRGVYLLYGPSIGQAFGSQARKMIPQISDYAETRVAHHLERLFRG
jgi:hypothetical protein